MMLKGIFMTDDIRNCIKACEWIDKLSERVNKMETTVQEIDKRSTLTDLLLHRFETAFTKLSDTMISIQSTMIEMQLDIKNNSKTTDVIKNEIREIKSKFDESEEKHKVDVRILIKSLFSNKITWAILGFLVLVKLISELDSSEWQGIINLLGK
jgi:hypothetical protein